MPDAIEDDEAMRALLDLLGIAESYIDFDGNTVAIPSEDRLQILTLMGVNWAEEPDPALHIRRLASVTPDSPLPRKAVVADSQGRIALFFTEQNLKQEYRWELVLENGTHLRGTLRGSDLPYQERFTFAGQDFSKRLWSPPPIEDGYHELHLADGNGSASTLLIHSPPRCFEPPWLEYGRHLAGLSVQLYELRSGRNWGIGDLSDLTSLIEQAAEQGIDFIVINPLHALDLLHPELCSPYSPLDRRYLNPLYIDVEDVPEFDASDAIRERVQGEVFQLRLRELRRGGDMDYRAVADLKLDILRRLHGVFQQQVAGGEDRAGRYRQWRRARGSALEAFARFEAQRQVATDPEFHVYLQFLAEEQLQRCQALARERGMALGLVRDLAVGGARDGAEVQLNPGLFSVDASIGAPPDVFAPQGQNWGLPPVIPRALEESRFAHFIELLHSNMAHCGALRIDHVMALLRLWWCPAEGGQGRGGYVHYPVDALFAIVRLESQRRRCVVIGEDLGVVPPEIRATMRDSAVLSNVLFYFEKVDAIHFRKPSDYPERALAMVANHDVPTLKCWWERTDLRLRREIGLLDAQEDYERLLRERESDLIQILHWLQEQDLLPDNWREFNIHHSFDYLLCRALISANGRAASLLVSVQLADLCLMEMPVNIPGTSTEYPNWRRKLPLEINEIFADPEIVETLSGFIASRREQD
ncbi:MAG: 4-alpha-glucanotransferase [Pseudohongiellaceae bacterium]